MTMSNEINFHDGYITNFKTKDKDIEFAFIDGFEENKIFKIKLSNVEIFIGGIFRIYSHQGRYKLSKIISYGSIDS